MAAVVFYRAPTDGLGLRKLKKQQQKKTLQWSKAIVFEKIIYIQLVLFKASPMRHKQPFLKILIKWANSIVVSATVCQEVGET